MKNGLKVKFTEMSNAAGYILRITKVDEKGNILIAKSFNWVDCTDDVVDLDYKNLGVSYITPIDIDVSEVRYPVITSPRTFSKRLKMALRLLFNRI